MSELDKPWDLRLFGGLLMAAAVIGAVVNLLHPITTGDLTETIEIIAGHHTWILLHVAFVVTLVALAAGLAGMVPFTAGSQGEPTARVAMVITVIGGTLAVASLAMDGIALKALADTWSTATTTDALWLFGDFITAKRINDALWSTTVLVFFGLAVISHGLAALGSGRVPGWLAGGALLSGAGSVAAAIMQFPSGGESRPGEITFFGSSILLTLWALALGYHWWRESGPTPKGDPVVPAVKAATGA